MRPRPANEAERHDDAKSAPDTGDPSARPRPANEGHRAALRALPLLVRSLPDRVRAWLDPKRPGSGLPARPVIRRLVWARRFVQAACFGLFLYLLVHTGFGGSFRANVERVRVGLPVEGFLLADPYVAAMTLLSTHTVYRGLLWSIGVLALTLIFGRVFCGWICPFGTLHHFTAWLFPSRYGRGGRRVEANKTHPVRQRVKYYLLYASLGAALAGSAIGGMFDPICISVRAIGLAALPFAHYVARSSGSFASETGSSTLVSASDATQDLAGRILLQNKQFYYHHAWLLLVLLVAIVFMNRLVPRFWCRALCPLGALLGSFARFALFGMEKDHSKCTDCNLCLVHCQGADSPQGGVKWRQDECHMCLNCEVACPEDVIKFRFLPGRSSATTVPDTARRTVIASAAAGAALIPAARIGDTIDTNYSPFVIRPPGSVEEREFLERCIRCSECMKVCPNNALHPALFEAGIEGIWTPILIPRIGYCEPSCVLCGDVCPTGAIQKITEEQKLGVGQKPISIGTAAFDHGRCLPWAMATPCIVCEEFCPTSPKAIWVEEAVVERREPVADSPENPAKRVHLTVQRPHVDPALCVGCGACEKVCPVQDKPAVYVTSIGETRSKTNVILLEGEDESKRDKP